MRKDWEVKKWSEVLSIINGKNQKKVEDNNGAYPIYGSGGVMGYASDYLCPGNSVIIGRKGNINKPLFVKEKFWNVDTAFGLISKEGILDSKYLFYFCVNKAVTIPSLTKTDLLNIRIDLPPLQIQQQIVEELDSLTSIIEKQKKQLEELDNLAQSIFYDMFGNPIENEKGWDKIKLVNVCKNKGTYGAGSSSIPKVLDRPRYIRITDILETGELNDDYVVSSNIEDDANYLLTEGDILFARSGATVGKTYLYRGREAQIYAGYLIKFSLNQKYVDPLFVFYITKSNDYKIWLQRQFVGVAQPNINAQKYGNLPIILPSLSLQQQFAAKIEVIEKQKELIKKSIKETEDLFNSRMDYYFN